jgi:hypothetical protein
VRRHFPELVGLCFFIALSLAFLFVANGGTALMLAIGLSAAGYFGARYEHRRRLRRHA